MEALIFDKAKYTWEDSRGFEIIDVPKPVLDDEKQVIIKVHYAGVCGTDKGIWNRQAMRDQILGSIEEQSHPHLTSPLKGEEQKNIPSPRGGGRGRGEKTYRILGHEFFGEIVEVGKAVAKEFKLKKGDFVSCESHVICNECYQCLHGEQHVCTNEKILGISHDGGFAEYVKVPGHIVWLTDRDKIRPEVAAVQEPFGNAVHAASRIPLQGKTVAIFGLGPIGLFTVLIARGMGARTIIGIEPNPATQEMGKKLGLDHVLAGKVGQPEKPYAHDPELTGKILELTGGAGVDVAMEMAGQNSSLNNAIFATRRGGDVILFGIKNADFVLENYNNLIVRGLTLHAIIGRQIWQTWEGTRQLLQNRKNHIQESIYDIILKGGRGTILPIHEYTKEKFEKMMNEHPKFLIRF